ncbi:MAG: prepilin-type N-terminal cleavage/methylation domain-containing protein [Patescibacteria group bacterium]|nr:prepilin-type N-terminal cleavage/methylation domain-containing protein [Patescibacteria group bacterium]
MTRGFTLVELLIVIAILVVLAVAVVLVLNPAELIKQSRDATRISDLSTLNSAIAYYLSVVTTPTWATTVTSTCTVGSAFPYSTSQASACTTVASQIIDGNGWAAGIDLTLITSGSPLARLPLDPVNVTTTTACPSAAPMNIGCFYAFRASSSVGIYEINANMESNKYRYGGAADVESKDGGNNDEWYEVGSNLSL